MSKINYNRDYYSNNKDKFRNKMLKYNSKYKCHYCGFSCGSPNYYLKHTKTKKHINKL